MDILTLRRPWENKRTPFFLWGFKKCIKSDFVTIDLDWREIFCKFPFHSRRKALNSRCDSGIKYLGLNSVIVESGKISNRNRVKVHIYTHSNLSADALGGREDLRWMIRGETRIIDCGWRGGGEGGGEERRQFREEIWHDQTNTDLRWTFHLQEITIHGNVNNSEFRKKNTEIRAFSADTILEILIWEGGESYTCDLNFFHFADK